MTNSRNDRIEFTRREQLGGTSKETVPYRRGCISVLCDAQGKVIGRALTSRHGRTTYELPPMDEEPVQDKVSENGMGRDV